MWFTIKDTHALSRNKRNQCSCLSTLYCKKKRKIALKFNGRYPTEHKIIRFSVAFHISQKWLHVRVLSGMAVKMWGIEIEVIFNMCEVQNKQCAEFSWRTVFDTAGGNRSLHRADQRYHEVLRDISYCFYTCGPNIKPEWKVQREPRRTKCVKYLSRPTDSGENSFDRFEQENNVRVIRGGRNNINIPLATPEAPTRRNYNVRDPFVRRNSMNFPRIKFWDSQLCRKSRRRRFIVTVDSDSHTSMCNTFIYIRVYIVKSNSFRVY